MRPTHRVTVPVDVPGDVETAARRRAAANGEPDRLEAYLLDYVRFDYDWQLEGDGPP